MAAFTVVGLAPDGPAQDLGDLIPVVGAVVVGNRTLFYSFEGVDVITGTELCSGIFGVGGKGSGNAEQLRVVSQPVFQQVVELLLIGVQFIDGLGQPGGNFFRCF